MIDGKRIGHFPARERRHWGDAFGGRNVKGILYIDVPAGTVEFRFHPDRIGESLADAAARSPSSQHDHFCSHCGTTLRPGLRFCTRCGSSLNA